MWKLKKKFPVGSSVVIKKVGFFEKDELEKYYSQTGVVISIFDS